MDGKANLRRGILYMLASVVALGFMPSLVRSIYEASELTALQVSAWRFILAAPMLWLFTMLNHREGHPISRRSRAIFGRAGSVGIFYGLAVVAFFSSLERIPIPVFILIFYSYPIIVAALSRILGERLSRWFWPAALMTVAGVALTVVVEGEAALAGAVLALVSAYLIAMYFVVNQRILRRWYGDEDASNVAIGVAWIVTSGALTLALIAFLSGEGLGLAAAGEVWWMLLLLSAVVSFGAYMMNLGIQRLGAASAAVVATAEPLFTLFFAWLLLGEWLAPLQIVAGGLILGSALMRAWRQWQRAEPAPRAEWPEEPAHALTPDRALTTASGERSGYIWLALNMVGASLLIILTRGLFRQTLLDSLDINFWRYLLATPLMWLLVITALAQATPVAAGQAASGTDIAPDRRALIGLGVLFAGFSVVAAFALQYVIAGLFGILFYATYPTMVALLSLAQGERLPRMFWLVLLGTFAGLLLVMSPDLLGAQAVEGNLLGVALTLLSAFLNACYVHFSRRVLRATGDVPRAVAWTMVGAFLTISALVMISGLRLPDGRDAAFLLGMVLFGTLLPRVALYLGIQLLGAPRVALVSTVTPFATVVLAVLLLNEFLTVSQLIGGALILASMIVLARASAPQETPPQEQPAPPEVQLSAARP